MDLNSHELNPWKDKLLNDEVNLRDKRETLKETLRAHLSQLLDEHPRLRSSDLANHLTYRRVADGIGKILRERGFPRVNSETG